MMMSPPVSYCFHHITVTYAHITDINTGAVPRLLHTGSLSHTGSQSQAAAALELPQPAEIHHTAWSTFITLIHSSSVLFSL